MALQENKYTHLVELSGSDYEIADGQPDIRGWKVKNEFGQLIGEVDELLFSPSSEKVRYIIIDVDRESIQVAGGKKILAPIGVADLYDDGRIQTSTADSSRTATEVPEVYDPVTDGQVVIVPVSIQQIDHLPPYTKDLVDPETEMLVRHTYEGTNDVGFVVGSGAYDPEEFYRHRHFDEDRFYEGRRRSSVENPIIREDTGSSRIRRRPSDDPSKDSLEASDPY